MGTMYSVSDLPEVVTYTYWINYLTGRVTPSGGKLGKDLANNDFKYIIEIGYPVRGWIKMELLFEDRDAYFKLKDKQYVDSMGNVIPLTQEQYEEALAYQIYGKL